MRISLSLIDYAVIGIYFAFVIGVGWALKRSMTGQRRLPDLGPLAPGLDHRAGLHFRQPGRAGSHRHGAPPVPSTAS